MPINVPATQVEDFTSRMDGGKYSSFTADTQLSSPMTGTVRFDFDVNRNCYLHIRVLNMDGEEVRITLPGWTRQTSGSLRYRQMVRSSDSSTTVDIPEGYQLVATHLGSSTSTDATINHFSVTGFSEGLVEKVWYNEWIAEVYQGHDLIYKGPEPVEVEIEDLVGGEHVLSREVRCVGKELNPQHIGNMWMGITQWGLSKI